ncbi:hypothetical protein [Streptomyces sp. CB01881]|uniref:hypothetical protein n=1 Tax=Streptomyces sp. CB01881 TaxID=2078691 RepID=UPI000CDBB67B|nr:hypothetical protein [Streptomyces sp. CB01881]AUY53751.1 hypothetical protein C2142_38565 [Streptomyces sp. CB01881]TYC68762.1 hypothetical protein EH183_38565 [Streptomyces sp. CB01881]
MVRSAAPTLARRRAELFVVDDIDLRRMRLSGVPNGRRRSFAVRLMSAPLRRITVVEGERGLEPMALFGGRHGRMIGRLPDATGSVSMVEESTAVERRPWACWSPPWRSRRGRVLLGKWSVRAAATEPLVPDCASCGVDVTLMPVRAPNAL